MGRHGYAARPIEELYIPEPNSGCWLWLGAILKNGKRKRNGGYGIYSVRREDDWRKTKTYRAHRFMWERENGPVPAGLTLDHKCRVRCCVNPDHIEPVTNAENARRGAGTKLSLNDVMAIRREYAPAGRGGTSGRELAQRYGVSGAAIVKIIARTNWATCAR